MSSDKKIRVGVVGVGVLGRHHARLYKEVEGAEIVGIFDVCEENAKKVSEEFDIPVFDTIESLADACEALSIAVPATLHHKTAMPLLEKGKHLLIEKPLATTVAEAEAIVNLAKEKNLSLGVGQVERFNPAMEYLEKRCGKTRFIEAHRLANYPPPRPGQHRRGTEVGVVLDLMIHDIDLVLSMVEGKVERFDAVGIPVLSKTEDLASVRIKFENGSVANLTASRVSEHGTRRFRVFQTDAYISMDYSAHTGKILKKGKLGLKSKDVELDSKNALHVELQDFVNSVRKTEESGKVVEPKVSGQQGFKALKLAVAISEEIHRYNKYYGVEFA